MRQVRNAFPDFHNKIEQLVAEGHQVIARLQYTDTHRGEIFGVRPSGKSISYAGVAFFRIAGSRVAEGWVLGDLVSLLQLGAQTLPNPTN
jgi:predicted ester cyclase